MDAVGGDKTFEQTILRYAAGLFVILLFVVAYPTYVQITTLSDFAADRLETHRATVVAIDYDSGWDTAQHWTSQQLTLRLDDGAERTESMSGTMVDVQEGDMVSVGLSHGRLVSVEGVYVRSKSAVVGIGLLIMAGAFVLSAISAVQIRRPTSTRSTPYTSGYVTQAVVLCLLLTLVPWPGRLEAWGPVIALVLAAAIPLTIFRARHRRPAPAVISPDNP
ncbi:hypothetical protein Q0Z83_025010 [Actinoplanes sichuanensis]|uniref:Uncharacterized protein n=1 Tax=Actinoplanes sichuanensis TaxID=512349 RepID=A0ABW4A049_9ACTN|nr:hypothetical protein [Actinoplanes sichuanensis]BEL04310.1 hypothetical protein Q0Z83_025010 [Actinoplanes sichuanensis]